MQQHDPIQQEPEVKAFVTTTEAQREIWATMVFDGTPASLSYIQPFKLHFEGRLERQAMEEAFAHVVSRNEALQVTFSRDGSTMCATRGQIVPLRWEDLSVLDSERRDARRQSIAEQMVTTPFDLVRGPIVRATLVKLEENLHELFFASHHIVLDGWSVGVVLEQLSKAYNQSLAGRSRPNTWPTANSFLRYAQQEANFLDSNEGKQSLGYWKDLYSNQPEFLELPRDGTQSHRGSSLLEAGRYDHLLDANLVRDLHSFSKAHRASVFVTLLSAFEAYLMRVCNQRDFSLGVPAAGQGATGQSDLVGHCVNMLPIRCVVDPTHTFETHLSAVRASFFDAMAHQRIPFGRLVRELDLSRKDGRTPLSTVTISFAAGTRDVAFEGLEYEMARLRRPFAQFPLSIDISEAKSGLAVECSYWKSEFSEGSLARVMRGFEALLRHAIDESHTALEALSLASPQQHASTVARWNDTDVAFDTGNVIELFDRQVELHGERPCSRYQERSLTYQEVQTFSERVCYALHTRGAAPGDRVAVVMNRTEELLPVLLGVMRAGCAYVPIDPTYPSARIGCVLDDAKVQAAIVHDEHVGLLRSGDALLVGREAVFYLGADRKELDAAPPRDWQPPSIPPDACAYIIHTSGSTGQPKGVPTHHAALSNYLQAYQKRVTRYEPGDTSLMVLSISFDGSVADLFVPLIAGASCAIADRNAALNPPVIIKHFEEFDIRSTLLTPSIWQSILESGWEGKRDLRAVTAGEAVSAELVADLLPRVGELWNGYGPTECTVITTMHQFEDASLPIRIGKPIANYRCYVLDENHRQVPVGVPGRLWIGGPGVCLGYLARSALNAEKFMDDPFEPGQGRRLYDSGDKVRWLADGSLEWLERFDNQVKIRGYRIELGEIETILRQVDVVAEAVVGVANVDGRGRTLVAFVRAEAASVGDEELRQVCRKALTENLPTYMVPAAIHRVEQFKLNPSGKVDRKALPFEDLAWNSTAQGGLREEPPRTPVEEALVASWNEVLGFNPGIHDNFFSIGGSSLDAIRLVEHVHRRGLSLQPTDIMRSPTVASLARLAVLQTAETSQTDTVVVLREEGNKAPLFVFHSVPGDLLHYGPLAQHLPPDRPIYGLQGLTLVDKLGAEQWSIQELARCYADQIEEVVGSGTVHLAGWCFGAHLALEVALQRQREGRGVGLVALLEAWPNRSPATEMLRNTRLLAHEGQGVIRHLKRKAQSLLRDRQRKDPRKVFALEVDRGPFKHRSEVYTRNINAARQHRTGRYDGPMLLIKTALEVSGQLEEYDYGWGEHAARGCLEVRDIFAEHDALLRPPHVQDVARILVQSIEKQEHLDKVRRAESPTAGVHSAASALGRRVPSETVSA